MIKSMGTFVNKEITSRETRIWP